MGDEYPKYVLAGWRPVKGVLDEEGNLGIYALNWQTGEFELDMGYLLRVIEVPEWDRVVGKDEFDRAVARIRAKIDKGR